MSPTERDFESIGLTSEDWATFILGRGQVPPDRLAEARRAIARLGSYTQAQAADDGLLDSALRMIGSRYVFLWHKRGDPISHEEKIRLVQVRDGCSREQAEERLARVREDNDLLDRISRGDIPDVEAGHQDHERIP
jgi:hypothetical protein